MKSTCFWRVFLYVSAVLFYGLFAISTLRVTKPPFLASSAAIAFLAVLLALLGISLYRLPWTDFIYLIVLFIPLEFTRPLGPFPSFSPVDYFSAVILIVLGLRLGTRLPDQFLQAINSTGIFLWAVFLLYGLLDALYLHGHVRIVLRWGQFLMAFFLMSLVKNQQHEGDFPKTKFAGLLTILGALLGVIGIFQFFVSGGNYEAVMGTFRQHNIMSAFLSFCLPASFFWSRSKGRPLWVSGLPLLCMLAPFVLAYSRGAWMGLLIGTVTVMLWCHLQAPQESLWKPTFSSGLFLLALCIIAAIAIQVHSRRALLDPSGRNLYAQAAFRVIAKHPILGLGPGNYPSQIVQYLTGQAADVYRNDPNSWQHLHNLYLQIAVEYGLAGGVLWLAAFFYLVYLSFAHAIPDTLSRCYEMSLIAFLIHNLVDVVTVCRFDMLFASLLVLVTIHTPVTAATE